MKWKELGFMAQKSSDTVSGFMYILPAFKNEIISCMIKNQHWVDDPKIVSIITKDYREAWKKEIAFFLRSC